MLAFKLLLGKEGESRWTRLQEGHEWAFLELCKRNSLRVFKTIYGVTKNREDAEDALQDSLMRALPS